MPGMVPGPRPPPRRDREQPVNGTREIRPEDTSQVTLLLESATRERRPVHIRGNGTWEPERPAELVLSTTGIRNPLDIDTSDLVASVPAGTPLEVLDRELEALGVWFAADPPGTGRTIGSVVATGSSGPLAHGFGPLRDQLLGLTLVTPRGAVVTAGGRVVKNVAGFDLTRLACGSFGSLGVITSVNIRLRIRPAGDATLVYRGTLPELLELAQELRNSRRHVHAAEITGAVGGDEWTLAVRILGTGGAGKVSLEESAPQGFSTEETLTDKDSADFWRVAGSTMCTGDTTLRLGFRWTQLRAVIQRIGQLLEGGILSASVFSGIARWAGSTGATRLESLREALAPETIPVTLERGSIDLCAQAGRFGSCPAGAMKIAERIIQDFDPSNILNPRGPIARGA